ncbi:MAG: RIP metalloprotease RseP [bacterium]
MILTIIIFVLVLGVLIFVHEFGHFLAARRAGLTVHEFGFGFPPRLIGFRRGKTLYSLNWIPVGGFVKIKGEDGQAAGEPDSFSSLAAWRRAGILLAGVTMNILFAMLLLGFLSASGAPTALDTPLPSGALVRDARIQIISLVENSPATRAGMQPGDIIETIDGRTFTSVEAVQQYNAQKEKTSETVIVRREKRSLELRLIPQTLAGSEDRAVWGVGLLRIGTVTFPWYRAIWMGIQQSCVLLWQILVSFAGLLQGLIMQQKLTADVAGPVGIAVLTGQVRSLGALYLIQFTALLSLNLALVNVLPFPALDGGRVFFLFLEKLRRKKVSERLEALIHNVGFVLLLMLVLVVTLRDVDRLTGGFMKIIGRLIGN